MQSILTINAGSSSIKFAIFEVGESLQRRLYGQLERIGPGSAQLTFNDLSRHRQDTQSLPLANRGSAANILIDWLMAQDGFSSVAALGHRVVHGMKHIQSEIVTPALLNELRRLSPYDPEHLRQRCPALPQVACFDTAFHHTMPRVAKLLPIPRRFDAKGIQRYGFHGLSYAYLMEELARISGAAVTEERVILAHLGNGASVAAVRGGKSIDTSMGFTPSSGLPMGTRSGDLDPGVAAYLARTERIDSERFYAMVNHESGLLGVSEISSDMRELLAREADDVRAAEAVALFCYQTKKCIGSFAAALGGLNTLVFAGGIGENSPLIRERICADMSFLGIALDNNRNAANASLISTSGSAVTVRVIRTDEELMIAKSARRLLL
jgi:acetate kinase